MRPRYPDGNPMDDMTWVAWLPYKGTCDGTIDVLIASPETYASKAHLFKGNRSLCGRLKPSEDEHLGWYFNEPRGRCIKCANVGNRLTTEQKRTQHALGVNWPLQDLGLARARAERSER